jgi:ribonuclease VapC
MVIDTSALLAVAFREPERERFSAAMLGSSRVQMSSANWAEAAIVADRRLMADVRGRFDTLIDDLGIEVVPFTVSQAVIAREAYRQFGLHSRLRALNYGDCFAYALARETNQPLLFKGKDFPKTDIRPALSV